MRVPVRLLLVFFLLFTLLHCGGGGSTTPPPPPPPPVPVAISVSPQSVAIETSDGSPVANTKQFTATVTNTTNTAVTWQVNGVVGGNSTYGTISATGLYSAPLLVPTEAVTVKAVAVADTSKSASAQVTLSWSIRNILIGMVNPGPTTVRANECMSLSASADTYANEKGVNWTINGSAQGGNDIGLISPTPWWPSGLNYVAPGTVASQFEVTLTATAKANPTKSKSLVLTVTPGDPNDPVLTISPVQATLPAASKQQFTAYINGQPGNATWNVNGTSTPPISDGRMQNGMYTAPFQVPAAGQVVVSAYISGYHDKYASAVVTITPPAVDPKTRVKGDYAFLLADNSHSTHLLGKITADGAGHLTGIADINSGLGRSLDYAFSGTYTMGLDGRGTASIKLPIFNGGTIDATFHLMMTSDNFGYVYEMDSSGSGTGFIEKQDASAFQTSAISGTFAFLLNGKGYETTQPGTKNAYALAMAGTMRPNGVGGVDGGQVDIVSKGAHVNDGVVQGWSTYSIGAGGRGTAALKILNRLSQFSVVVVSADKFLLSSSDDTTPIDALPMLIGTAEKQAGNLSDSSFVGPYVYYAKSDNFVQMGRFVATPGAPSQMVGVLDERGQTTNDTIMKLKQGVAISGSYGYLSERLWFNIVRQEADQYTYQPMYGYPVSAEKIFFVAEGLPESTGAVSGEAYAQHGEAFDDTTIQGTYAFQSVWPQDLGTGWVDREPNSQAYAIGDFQNYPDIPMSFQFYPPDNNGIGRMEISAAPNATINWSAMRYYIVSGSMVLFMGLGPEGYIGNDLGWLDQVVAP